MEEQVLNTNYTNGYEFNQYEFTNSTVRRMNASQLQFETSAELKAFIRKRNITHGKVNTTDIILTAVLTEKDIEVACKDFSAKVVGR